MGDDQEAGLGLGDQDCGESAVARQDKEKESFMAEERGDCRQDAHMNVGQNDRSHVSGTPLRRWVRGPAPHPRRCACCVSVFGAPRLA